MGGSGNVITNIFSMLLLIIMLANMYRRSREYLPDQKLFLIMAIANIAILFFDSMQWILDGKPGSISHYVNLVSNVLYYMFQILPCGLWCFYVRYQIRMDVEEMMRAKLLLGIPFLVNAVISILSSFYGYYFFVDNLNYYSRGSLFWLSVVFTYGYFLYSIIFVLINRKNTEKNIFVSLLLFSLPPLVGSLIQVLHYGYALIWPGVALSLTMIYINIQKNQLYTDHLTGLYNRRLLDIHLDACLKSNIKSDSIGVIMIDIDKFKNINDTFGHVIGDQALVETANALKKSIVKTGFTARYGGDEFVVVVPTSDKATVEYAVRGIEKKIEQLNRREGALYKLHLSMGYELFKCGGNITKYDVLCRIDRQMYEDKFHSRVIENQISLQ